MISIKRQLLLMHFSSSSMYPSQHTGVTTVSVLVCFTETIKYILKRNNFLYTIQIKLVVSFYNIYFVIQNDNELKMSVNNISIESLLIR